MISGVGSSSQMSQLFSRLDSKSQGYLEKSDLVSAFSAISGTEDSAAEELFAALDADSDGKVTESEFASTLSKLQEELDSQFAQMRMQGMGGHGPQGMGGMPPPPPNDEGFTQEELEAQLAEIGDTDSKRSSLISDIVSNFEAADSDGDGKVSFQEAMAYKDEQQSASGTEESSTAQASSSESQVLKQIMQLMHAYGRPDQDESTSLLSTLA